MVLGQRLLQLGLWLVRGQGPLQLGLWLRLRRRRRMLQLGLGQGLPGGRGCYSWGCGWG